MQLKGKIKKYTGKKGNYTWEIYRIDIKKRDLTLEEIKKLEELNGKEITVYINETYQEEEKSCQDAKILAALVDKILGEIPTNVLEKLYKQNPDEFKMMLSLLKKIKGE